MKTPYSSHGSTTLYNLLIIALVGVLAYLLYTKGRMDAYLPEEYRMATRVAAEGAEPSVAPGAASNRPSASASAPAASSGYSLAELSAHPRARWPRQVAVMREMDVQIVSNGRVAGSMKAKPGTLFELVDVRGEIVFIRAGGEVKQIPAGETDALARFRQIGK